MNAKELRIGNFVNAPRWRSEAMFITEVQTIKYGWRTEDEKSKYILCINHEFVETGYEYGPSIKDEVLPIQLTEEWLIKFGFKKEGEIKPFYKKYIGDDSVQYCEGIVSFSNSKNTFDLVIKSYNVHHFQNIVFYLTGEELIIK